MIPAPGFWQNPPERPGIAAHVLAPFAALAMRLSARRIRNGRHRRVGVPVICVGNINLGGTGKTPTVIALVERLKSRGRIPHVVSRGYGGSLAGPVKVDARTHRAADVGDEPVLLAGFCPTWVSRDRYAGAVAAVAEGADVIVLDDGLQNPSLAKDVSLMVVDAVAGFGNGKVFPSGPLREPLADGLARTECVLTVGSEQAQLQFAARSPMPVGTVMAQGTLVPLATGMDWQGVRVLAFAGIGRPEKFFATVRSLGAEVIRTVALADHQPLTLRLMQRLEQDSFFKGAQMVTTEKDATRLPEAFRFRVLTVPVRLEVADWSGIDAALAQAGIVAG